MARSAARTPDTVTGGDMARDNLLGAGPYPPPSSLAGAAYVRDVIYPKEAVSHQGQLFEPLLVSGIVSHKATGGMQTTFRNFHRKANRQLRSQLNRRTFGASASGAERPATA